MSLQRVIVMAATIAVVPLAARADEALCQPDKAAALAGKAAPSDAEAKALTGADTIRRIAPGQPVTFDHRPSRVTLEIRDGRIVRASCG